MIVPSCDVIAFVRLTSTKAYKSKFGSGVSLCITKSVSNKTHKTVRHFTFEEREVAKIHCLSPLGISSAPPGAPSPHTASLLEAEEDAFVLSRWRR
jgi:hypothetical protein